LLKEEIFGPLLPILKFKEFSEIQSIISNVEKPLTLYVFSKRRKFIDLVINNIQSGSLMVNDTLMHFANAYLPFGGIGNSGLGG
jgi:aldehyde dehydrogenase (NAD+)